MVDIIPAIMPTNLSDLSDHAQRVATLVPFAQIDVMDGIFVKGKTWPYINEEESLKEIVQKESRLPCADKIKYEVDLMVKDPEHVVEEWIQSGVQRIIVHIESITEMENIIRDTLSRVSLGLSLNTTTPIESIVPYIDEIDFVQCMGIAEIGKQGEPYDERVLDQLQGLRKRYPELILSVDGAVHLDNARALVNAGANRLVSGSEIFESGNIVEKLRQFNAILE